MANKLGSLLIQLAADTALLQRDMGKAVGIVNTGAKRMGDSITSAKRLLGGFVSFVAIKRGIEAVITASAESEAAMAQLEARIKSTGGVAGLSAKGISDFADQLQRTTTFKDEAITRAATRLLSFQNIRGDVFLEATRSALDLSAALGKDLSTAAATVGKALNDPIKGIALLTKQGVTYTSQQKALIKSLVETGDAAGAQRVHLDAMSTAMGGAAEAARNTLRGALESLKNTVGNLIENDTEGLPGLTAEINKFNDNLSDPKVKDGIDKFTSALLGGFKQIVTGAALVGEHIDKIAFAAKSLAKVLAGVFVGGMVLGPIGATAGAIAAAESIVREQNAKQAKANTTASGKIERTPPNLAFNPADLGPTAEQLSKAKAASSAAESAEKSRLASIKAVIDGLREQQATIGKSESALVAYKLQVLGATKAQVDFAVALSKANAIQEIIDALEQEGAALGLTGAALVEYQLRLQGASQAQIDFATAISRSNVAKQNDRDILAKEKTAREGLAEKIRQIKDEAITGLMDEVTAIRVAEGLKVEEVIRGVEERLHTEQEAAAIIANVHKNAAKDVAEALKKTTDGIGEFALEAARGIQNVLGDQLFNILQGNFENIGDQFKAMLDRMVAEALAAQLAKKMFGDFDTTGKVGGWFEKLIPAALGLFGGKTGGVNVGNSKVLPIGRAKGGPTFAGRTYIVGENEPEFFIPGLASRMRDLPPTPQMSMTKPYMIGVREAEIFKPKVSGMVIPMKDMSRDMFRERGGRVQAGKSYVVGEKRPEQFVPDMAGKEWPSQDRGDVTTNLYISGITDARGIREAGAQLVARAGASAQRALARHR